MYICSFVHGNCNIYFILYINDIVNTSRFLKFILFADDSTLYASHQDLRFLMHTVNNELNHAYNWILSNKLTLNIEKTQYIIFHRNKNIPQNLEPLKIGNSILKEVEHTKFFGVIVDRQLSWNNPIQNIINKLNKQCGILYLTRKYFNTKPLKLIYYSLIYPYLSYCHTVWGAADKTILNRILVAQKKVIRTITYRDKYAHTNYLFKSLGLLKLYDINIYSSGIFVYKSLHNYSNAGLFNYHVNDRYTLGNSNNLEIPLLHSNQSQTSIRYHGVKVWNQIPPDIQNKPTTYSFKSSLKSFLLHKY